MSLKVRELHHQAIRVPPGQAGEVQSFYEDVLGMETGPNRPDVPIPGAWMNVGGAQIHIVGAEGTSSFAESPERDPTRPHAALAVDSLTEARSELERLGVKYWELDLGRGPDAALLLFDDPAGNMIEIHQIDLCGCRRR